MAIVLNGQTNDVTIDGVSVATESEAVLKTGNETIAGVKTFSNNAVFNGNVGVGAIPSAWRSTQKVVELPGGGAISNFNGLTNLSMSSNMYINSSAQSIYKNNGYASYYAQSDSIHQWYTAPSGTAGNPITWTNAMSLDQSGNLLLKSGTGGLGYGTGSGGTVTQITSKLTAIALGKPSGRIITHNSSLSANSSALFQMINPCVGDNDTISWSFSNAGASASVDYTKYDLTITVSSGGNVFFVLRNLSGGALSDVITIDFTLNRGAIS